MEVSQKIKNRTAFRMQPSHYFWVYIQRKWNQGVALLAVAKVWKQLNAHQWWMDKESRVCVCIYIYIYIYIHTHIYIQIHTMEYYSALKKKENSGTSLIQILCFCRGHRFDLWWGNWDPTSHEIWPKEKENSSTCNDIDELREHCG